MRLIGLSAFASEIGRTILRSPVIPIRMNVVIPRPAIHAVVVVSVKRVEEVIPIAAEQRVAAPEILDVVVVKPPLHVVIVITAAHVVIIIAAKEVIVPLIAV